MPCLLTGQAKLASVPSGGGGGAAAPAGGADAGGKSKLTAFYSTGSTQCCPASSMHGRPCLKLTFMKYPAIHTRYSVSNCTISN